MEQKQSQLDGKMIEVFLSTTRNIATLTDIKNYVHGLHG
jgi:hypothetical protein